MSQKDDILGYLVNNPYGITTVDAFKRFGCTRLAARIADLRDEGHPIVAINDSNETGRFVRYVLAGRLYAGGDK